MKLAIWISDYYGASPSSVLSNMIPSGITKRRQRKAGTEGKSAESDSALTFTDSQQKIFDEISSDGSDKPHLIFGVTGSGKTEIYLQLVEKTLKEGKQAIILVPEIALTPQTIKRFSARLGDKVTILHSRLKETERFANWEDILLGKKQVVVGSRSALFAPFSKLGLIVIDEEHETSYKQDKTPRYNAVKTAEKLAIYSGAKLVLGSATPSIETFFRAKNGEIKLHQLNKRIIQEQLPMVEIIDMRNEFKLGNKSIFSDKLKNEMDRTLKGHRQVILFINRRGMSTFVSCRDCGHVEKCPNCEVPLTFHLNEMTLRCHHCNYSKTPPVSCPACKSWAIKYFGTGTQRVEDELKRLYKDRYSIGRIDADTTKSTGSHEEIYERFKDHKIDILIGTQMVAKGWDLPNVGLVGVISADTISNLPDYTSAERTFNLLTQVAGRTGRGEDPGRVIIQTYKPDNYAVKAAGRHDYELFYEQEILNRQDLSYPPFAKLVKILYNNVDQKIVTKEAENIKIEIENNIALGKYDFHLLGPSPAFIEKRAGKYFWQIILKLKCIKDEDIINQVAILGDITGKNWSIDVDPSGLL